MAATEDFPLRMRDLVRITGVSAPTIHFYAQQGLLPDAVKTAGNQARYSAASVARIEWIRELQAEHRLPLRSIRWILDHHGQLAVADVGALLTVGRLLEEPDPQAPATARARVRARLGDDVDRLLSLGIVGDVGGTLSDSDIRLLDIVAALREAGFTDDAGFTVESLAVYRDAVDRLIAEELRQFLAPLLARTATADVRDLVRRGLPLADQLLSVLHRRAVHSELQRLLGDTADVATTSA